MGKRFTLMWGTLIRAQRISITIIIYIFNIMIIAINTIIFTIFTIFPIMKMMTNKGVCPNEPRGEGGVPGSSRVCSSGPRNLQGNPNSVENNYYVASLKYWFKCFYLGTNLLIEEEEKSVFFELWIMLWLSEEFSFSLAFWLQGGSTRRRRRWIQRGWRRRWNR